MAPRNTAVAEPEAVTDAPDAPTVFPDDVSEDAPISSSSFWEFTVEEPPESDNKRAKYDNLVAECFAHPGHWAKLTKTFTSNATATNLRKRYADYEGPTGEVIEVRSVRVNDLSGKPQYAVYLRATSPDEVDEDAAEDE